MNVTEASPLLTLSPPTPTRCHFIIERAAARYGRIDIAGTGDTGRQRDRSFGAGAVASDTRCSSSLPATADHDKRDVAGRPNRSGWRRRRGRRRRKGRLGARRTLAAGVDRDDRVVVRRAGHSCRPVVGKHSAGDSGRVGRGPLAAGRVAAEDIVARSAGRRVPGDVDVGRIFAGQGGGNVRRRQRRQHRGRLDASRAFAGRVDGCDLIVVGQTRLTFRSE